jgi:tRNA modification GTPase
VTPATIAAISTPPGRGGLGVVRISGPAALAIGEQILARSLAPRRARWAELRDGQGGLLDHVVATYFPAPRSATGEDVVEISAHGSPVLLQALLENVLAAGARLADPGEFTRRAFLNRRIDLAQAEAIADLIAAHTLHQARSAARQMGGSVARLLQPAHALLVTLIARLEAGIDFADDDVTVMADANLTAEIGGVDAELRSLAAGFERNRALRDGVSVVLVGRPNVGKSSLFNRLLERERAIVTAEPGTTRDWIEDTLDWDGLAVKLRDTAGIRRPAGEAERQGIERSWMAAADADFILAVVDGSQPPEAEDRELMERWQAWPRALLVRNKADLPAAGAWRLAEWNPGASLEVSARTGAGMDGLRAAVRAAALPSAAAESDAITNLRHARQIALAREHLEQAAAAVGSQPHEALLVDLHEALHALDAITGQTTVEDILEVIFSTFCIGK